MRHDKFILISVLAALMLSCSDLKLGNASLSDPPEDSGATLDSLFASSKNADKVLVAAYSYLPYGLPTSIDNKMGGGILESITDLQHSNRNNVNDGPVNLYYSGSLSASLGDFSGNEAYRFGSESDYSAIKYAWIFIENAHRIPDISEGERNEMIAQAKVCIAIAYSNMLRYCGGVPIIDHAVGVNESMNFPRATFEETVDFIVRMCDEAKPDLNWYQSSTNSGRMTSAAALALKLRVLCFAASPTFNSDTKFHKDANLYHCYGNYDQKRWVRAKNAAVEFITEQGKLGYYGLETPTSETHEARRLAYRKGYYERGSRESIISIRQSFNVSLHNSYFDSRIYSGPTLNWVNMFPWEDGSDFPENFDWSNPSRQPFFEDGVPTRDPRLYENAAVPGDLYYNGTIAAVHKNHPNYRAGGSGFLPMKFILRESADRAGKAPHWPYLRYAEVLLNAAEAFNEAEGGPTNAYKYVNEVRARVGLPGLQEGMSREEFRKALISERALEFGYEEVRWFDMVRWGLVDDFCKKLYGLESKGNHDKNPRSFTFSTYELPVRAWAKDWDTKWYLAPIPRTEVDKKYGMTQNPGW